MSLMIIETIVPLFLIIFVSGLLRKFFGFGEGWGDVLNSFVLKFGLPVLIFNVLVGSSVGGSILVTNSIFLLVISVLVLLLGRVFKFKKEMVSTLFICSLFNNIAYLGIPVITRSLGQSPDIGLVIAVHLFWIFTLGVGYLDYADDKSSIKKVLKRVVTNPLLIAVVLGLSLGSVPSFISESLDMIASSVTPIVLVVIGLFMGRMEVGSLRDWIPAFFFSLFSLLVLPFIFYTLFPGSEVSILMVAMPVAITPFVLAEEYGLDKDFIARSVVLSTTLAVLSLPFWLGFL